ncbi:hypothetical protein BU23DRAFT_565156 [Bimuria novae-zelandiae CBS 107.79]|uniref:Uncharacterized protein n=1 Tax=Bimuria novae-zelandiae CBS 107.79 TaxID=1447943 RepID=A0A6A5VJX4_9PLEO|nr:hypothetical protein BU23DRAFT_565156 [Bimuria novae-zelandiae CBS 107.79]
MPVLLVVAVSNHGRFRGVRIRRRISSRAVTAAHLREATSICIRRRSAVGEAPGSAIHRVAERKPADLHPLAPGLDMGDFLNASPPAPRQTPTPNLARLPIAQPAFSGVDGLGRLDCPTPRPVLLRAIPHPFRALSTFLSAGANLRPLREHINLSPLHRKTTRCNPSSMANSDRSDQPAEVASRVLRRAQVSKVTRTLQNRLAFANVKIKHGWQDLSLDHLEPRVDVELKRKRPGSSNGTMSNASSVSERFYQDGILDSSPLAAPIFSDEIGRSGSRSSNHSHQSYHSQQSKKLRYTKSFTNYPGTSNHNRAKVRTSTTASHSWKNSFQLPESSPVYHRRHARFGRVQHAPSLSFVSETSTVPDPHSPLLSEDDDDDLPVSSFQINKSFVRSSPPRVPRTPPPGLARSARLRQNGFTAAGAAREGQKGEEDVGLLMHFATSPSPARPGDLKPHMLPPSTPPPKSTPLPSSMMSTPGGGPHFGFGLQTPNANLNFADFLNMSPSPAQVNPSWNRTPIASKTPIAAREARRRLNFDTLLPPTSDGRVNKVEGLGMDLGGELVS